MAVQNFVKTGAGTCLSIGDAAISGTPDLTAYQAASYDELNAEGFDRPSKTFSENTFTPTCNGVVQKSKGEADLGTISITVGELVTDAAQTSIEAALNDLAGKYPFRIEYTKDGTTTSGFAYFTGRVMSMTLGAISPNGNRTISYQVAIVDEPLKVAAT